MRIHPRRLLLLSASAVAVLAVACGGGDDGNTTSSSSEASSSGGNAAPAAAAQGGGEVGEATREIEVLMKDNFFEPTEIRLAVGEAVTIAAKNDGVAIHNMHVLSAATEGKDFTSAPLVNPGETSEFTVQFSQPGTYKFQCDFHLPGMVGEIIVE